MVNHKSIRTFLVIMKTETILYLRGFFGPFFTLLLPIMMVLLFGSIFGNEPSTFFSGLGAMDASCPAYVGMVIAVNALMTLPLQLSEYQGNKVYKRFDATPIGKGKIVAAQVTIYSIASILGSLVLIFFGKVVYHIQIIGRLGIIIPIYLLSLISMFSLGFFIASVFKNPKIVNLVSYLLYFLMLFVSGATLPSEMFPENVKLFTQFLPLTHVVDLLKGSFAGTLVKGDIISILILAVITCVCIIAGSVCYRRRRWA